MVCEQPFLYIIYLCDYLIQNYHLFNSLILWFVSGSDRTSESIRTKIIRIMQSYKEANERMLRSGNGLKGLKNTTFQEYIVQDICKYYFILDPVLKDRPNIKPRYTNEEESSEESKNHQRQLNTILLSSDEDSVEGFSESRDDCNTHITVDLSNNSVASGYKENNGNEYDSTSTDDTNETASANNNSSFTTTSHLSEDNNTNVKKRSARSSSNRNISSSSSTSPKKKQNKGIRTSKLSPIEAKKIQKTLVINKKRTIARRKMKGSLANLDQMEQEERDSMIETRNKKMSFENKRHMDMKVLEEKKIEMERERLDMEKNTLRLRHENLELQNNSERSKLVLLRLEMFKHRQEIKRSDPTITEEYLDELFPYPQ